MSESARDTFVDLERHRLQLEENVRKLRASLHHWQAWEIEYEGMKEDILGLANDDMLESLGNEAENSLLTEKERRLLLRDEGGNLRRSQQVLDLLSRRIDYVQQNIKTVSSLLQVAEDKYTASQVLSQPEVRNEDGLPLTEIHEELDEEGNVISSSMSEPGKVAPQVVEALRKAGINELPETEAPEGRSTQLADQLLTSKMATHADGSAPTTVEPGQGSTVGSSVSNLPANDVVEEASRSKKSVSFAEDTKVEEVPRPKSGATREADSEAGLPKPGVHSARAEQRPASQRPNSMYDVEKHTSFEAVVPENESPEDAALRRQMIDYNLGEVGAIVAELDLDEDDASYSDNESELNDDDHSSVEDDEDKFGRTKRRVLSDEYLAEMQRLEQRLKNVGPGDPAGISAAVSDMEEEQQAGNGADQQSAPNRSKPAIKKGVRFANDLDIQEAPARDQSAKTPVAPRPAATPEPQPIPRKSVHVPTVIERSPSATIDPSTVREPDECDPALVQQEISTTYYRMRNRMIQQQGGFTNDEGENEKGEVPLTESEGGPKKVSRFKAARLGKLSN